jgi:hypothetical protein
MGWRAGFHPGYTSTAGFHHVFQRGLRPNARFQIGTVTAYAGASMFVFLVYRVSLGTRALAESQRCMTLLRGRLQGHHECQATGGARRGSDFDRCAGGAACWVSYLVVLRFSYSRTARTGGHPLLILLCVLSLSNFFHKSIKTRDTPVRAVRESGFLPFGTV